MPQELIYTSAPHGLFPGSGGFCTVACTVGMSSRLVAYLESLSGYRHVFPPQSDSASLNPVSWSHTTVRAEGTTLHVLSRVADAGLDYTKRSNVIAHHIVLRPEELPPGGPAGILSQPHLFSTHWDGRPRELPEGLAVPSAEVRPGKCVLWENVTGDAAWGGLLAETALKRQPACILFEPGTDLLPLIAESVALLPEPMRWNVLFNTFLSEHGSRAYQWKCLRAGTPEAVSLSGVKGALVIDLTRPSETLPETAAELRILARTGRAAVPPRATTQESTSSVPSRRNSPLEPPVVVEVPPILGGTYGLIVEPAPKRKRPRTGPWSAEYETHPIEAEKARKEFRLFVSIMIVAMLGILVLLTLIADEVFHHGMLRKNVTRVFSGSSENVSGKDAEPGNAETRPPQRDLAAQSAGEDGGSRAASETKPVEEKPAEDVSGTVGTAETTETTETEGTPLTAEELQAWEQEQEQERLRLQQLQEEAARRLQLKKENMRNAFAAIPGAFELAEPQSKPFGGVALTNQLVSEMAPLYPFREQVRLRWFAFAAPRNWTYRLDRIPQRYTDDPARWDLIARNGRKEPDAHNPEELVLCSLFLVEEGLRFEWNGETAGREAHFELVNKLPFSYLRVGLGPAFDLDHLREGFTRNTATFSSSPPDGVGHDGTVGEDVGMLPEDGEKTAVTENETGHDAESHEYSETPAETSSPPFPETESSETEPFDPDWMNRPFATTAGDDPARIDFTQTATFKDVRLLIPYTFPKVKPVRMLERGGMSRPNEPVETVTNLFGSDRWRYALENLTVQDSLLLQVRAECLSPGDGVTVQVFPEEVPWKKRIAFTTDVFTRDGNPVVISVSAKLGVEQIEFRDNSFAARSEAGRYRTIARTIREKEERLAAETSNRGATGERAPNAHENAGTALIGEIEALKNEHDLAQDMFQKINVARKKVLDTEPVFHFSARIQGDKTESLPLLSTEGIQ